MDFSVRKAWVKFLGLTISTWGWAGYLPSFLLCKMEMMMLPQRLGVTTPPLALGIPRAPSLPPFLPSSLPSFLLLFLPFYHLSYIY